MLRPTCFYIMVFSRITKFVIILRNIELGHESYVLIKLFKKVVLFDAPKT